MLAVTDKNLLFAAVGGEILLYLLYKVARGELWIHFKVGGAVSGVFLSFTYRLVVKVIVDFTGCVHFRNPLELGALAFSLSMLWAQIFPFVTLTFFEDDDNKEAIFEWC